MAGFFENEDLEKVRSANDIVSVVGDVVRLQRRGRDFWCCCPFHEEKTPSMKVDAGRQNWHCFGCGEGGDVFAFVMKYDNITFPEAVQKLAERAHIELPERGGRRAVPMNEKARLKAVCKEAAAFFHRQLMRGRDRGASEARDYLSGRGLGGDIPKEWNLGFAPGRGTLLAHLKEAGFTPQEIVGANVATKGANGLLRDRFYDRIMFPITDVQGDVIAFGGRVIGQGEPKYLNSQETPIFHKSQVLYGFEKAKAEMTVTGTAIVVEGYTDVISLHAAGIRNVVATLGTSLTIQHIRAIERFAGKRIVYLFDGDEAGQRAADRALGFIDASMTPEAGRTRIELCAVTLPDNLDPADFVKQRGGDALRALIDSAEPLLKYGIERRFARYDLTSAEGRSAALAAALEVLAPIKDSLLAKDYAVQIAGRVRAREDEVLKALDALTPPRRFDEREEGAHPAAEPAGQARAASMRAGSLPTAERNRLRFEREFLSVIAQNPAMIPDLSRQLASVAWHESVHERIADYLLEASVERPEITTAELITGASQLVAAASAILTSYSPHPTRGAFEQARFLGEELELEDLEASADEMRAQLSVLPEEAADEREMVYQSVVALQNEIRRRRQERRP